MPRSKEKEMCTPANDPIINTLVDCIEKNCECIAIYIDYNVTRHPFTTIYGYIVPCNNMSADLEGFVGEAFLEMITKIDLIINPDALKNSFMDHITSLMIRCGNGWIKYGYTTIKSPQGIPHASRAWLYVSDDGEQKLLFQMEENSINTISKLVKLVSERAREILEYEQ